MSPDAATHTLIARPLGLPGHAPKEWCAVCGKTIKNETVQCHGNNCPNKCHVSCLGDKDHFDCFEVFFLRTALNISDRVIYVKLTIEEENSHDVETNELLQLEKKDLIAIIARLQTELTRKNSTLSYFSSIATDIASKRDAIVTVLNFVDNIIATKSSLEELEVRSTACSACPDRIDEDWNTAVEADQELKNWWTSEKPKKLRKVCHLETSVNGIVGEDRQLPGPSRESQQASQPKRDQRTYSSNTTQAATRPQQRKRSNYSAQRPSKSLPNNFSNYQNTQKEHNKRSSTNRSLSFGNQTTTHTGYQPKGHQESVSCSVCGKRGHRETNCYRLLKCDYCHRSGHQAQDCRTRKQEERQEHFFRNLAAEQAKQSALLVQSVQRLVPFSQPNQLQPAPGAVVWPSHTSNQNLPNTQYHYN